MAFYYYMLVLVYVSSNTKGVFVDKNLMMAKSGWKVNVELLWQTPGSLNDPENVKHTWNISKLIKGGNFRSALVDEWNQTRPDEISINLCNTQGDILWYVRFRSASSNVNIQSWLSESKILTSSTTISSHSTAVHLNKTNFPIYLSSALDSSKSLFAIWNGEILTNDYPVFLFSTWFNRSGFLNGTDFLHHAAYGGCWPYYSLNRTFKLSDPYMSLEMCNMECVKEGQPYILMEAKKNCWCGGFMNQSGNNVEDSFCAGYCPGREYQICGLSSDMHAVYPVQRGVILPQMPMNSTLLTTVTEFVMNGQKKIMANVSQYKPEPDYPLFLTGVSVSVTVGTSMMQEYMFNLGYNQWNCSEAHRKIYTDSNGLKQVFSTNGSKLDVEILPVRCMWIIFVHANEIEASTAVIGIFKPQDYHFAAAPAMVVIGHWRIDDTSTVTPKVASHTTSDYITTGSSTNSSTTISPTDQSSDIHASANMLTDKSTTPVNENLSESLFVNVTSECTSTDELLTVTTTSSIGNALWTPAADPSSDGNLGNHGEGGDKGGNGGDTHQAGSTLPVQDGTIGHTETLVDSSVTSGITDKDPLSTDAYGDKWGNGENDHIEPSTISQDGTTESLKHLTEDYTTATENLNSSPKPCPCNCSSKNLTVIDPFDLDRRIQEITRILTLNKTLLSSHIRKLQSAADDRLSAKGIGYTGAIILFIVIALITMCDLTSLYDFMRKRNTACRKSFQL